MKSHPKFLPELTRNIFPGLNRCAIQCYKSLRWKDENKLISQNTLATYCLVSREWNRTFTPILYGDPFLGVKNPLLTQSRLHRIFRRTRPVHKALVKTMTIVPAEDGSTANLLSICFSMPNLRKLILDFKEYNLSTLHPSFVQHLRSLSKRCTLQIAEDGDDVDIGGWGSLLSYVDFTRRSRSTSCKFRPCSSGSR